MLIQFGTSLHSVNHCGLSAIAHNRFINIQSGFACCAERWQRIQNQRHAVFSQLALGIKRSRTKLGNVGQYRHFHCICKLAVHFQIGHGFRENHVRTGFDTSLSAFDSGIQTFYRQRIGTRHNHEVLINTRIYGSFDTVDHFIFRNDGFVRTVAAAFLRYLIFDVNRCNTSAFKVTNSTGNVKCTAPTYIDVHQ